MSTRRALIVDDSKSARVVLSRMLEQHNLDVDMAESAEQALEYLASHRPDVIFMDHLMPGMDGFQAVQAIKNNPRTATIPIMMYTSQEGDLYVGQARALGATGVLPKQLKPVDVSKVLYQLNLMPDRHEAEVARLGAEPRAPSVVVMADSAAAQAASQYASGHGKPEPPAQRSLAGELRAQIESLIREQTTELRRFVIASLDSYASRVVSDLRGAPVDEVIIENGDELPPPRPRHTARNFAIAATMVAVVLAAGLVWFGFQLKGLGEQNSTLRSQLAGLEQSNRQLTNQLGSMAGQSPFGATAPPSAQSAAGSAVSPQLAGGVVATPAPTALVEAIPYGEVPLAVARVDTVRSMLSQLTAQGFAGTLRIEIFPGRFCLAGNASDGYSLAPDELAYAKCDLVGNPSLDNMAAAQRQSLAFVNMIADMERASGGNIRVNIISGSADRVATPYPNSAADGMSAGQWNHAASANNRIEITTVAGN